jgi:uncharacterized protein
LCRDLKVSPSTLGSKKELIELGALVEDEETERRCLEMEMNRFRYSSPGHISLTILTTSKCNLCCPYCYEAVLSEAGFSEVMDVETEAALVPFLEAQLQGAVTEFSVTWYGGEPLLNLDTIFRLTPVFIDACSKKGITYRATVVTNATLLDLDILKRLTGDAAVSSFQITLEAGKRRHDTSRISINGQPTYEQIIAAAAFIIEQCNVDIRVNVDASSTFHEIKEVLDSLRDAGVLESGRSSVYLGRLLYFLNKSRIVDNRQIDEANYAALIAHFLPYLYGLPACKTEEQKLKLLLNFVSKKGPQKQCGAVSPNSMVVDAAGRLYKCWEEVGQPSRAVADVRRPDYYNKRNLAFWLGSGYWKNPSCKYCPVLPVCKSGCAYFSLSGYPKATYRCDFVFPVVLSALVRLYARKLFSEEVSSVSVVNWPGYPADIPL